MGSFLFQTTRHHPQKMWILSTGREGLRLFDDDEAPEKGASNPHRSLLSEEEGPVRTFGGTSQQCAARPLHDDNAHCGPASVALLLCVSAKRLLSPLALGALYVPIYVAKETSRNWLKNRILHTVELCR